MFKKGRKPLFLLVVLLLLVALSVASLGAQEDSGPVAVPQNGVVAVDLESVSVIVTLDESVDAATLEAAADGQIVHSYSEVFNGVSLIMPGDKVEDLAELDGVTGVYLDRLMQPDTERSPDFIGAPTLWNQLGGQGNAGEGTVVGVLDSGIWPEHPSYADPDPSGKPYDPPPVVPGSNGTDRSTCAFGNSAFNPDDVAFTCNNKLIGAYEFLDTYKLQVGLISTEFDSARDSNGHGTHTSSTAAGNGGVNANLLGVPRGAVSGIAPRAHVIMYRVCGVDGCYSSDSVAAVEQAMLDGVDAINFSISGGGNPYSDAVELAFSQAYENGVFVSASAGNAGPGPETVAHRGPWTMTVAASTSDRHFLSTVDLTADNGDTLTVTGATVTAGIHTPTDVVLASDYGDGLCLNPFAPGTFSGQIVICERGLIARVAKSFNVGEGGAGGMLLYNPVLQGLSTDNHFIPSVHLENDAGQEILDFMAAHSGVTGMFTDSTAATVQGDKMAPFSSRGGPAQPLGISKPDITAPGVQILAGHTPLPENEEGGLPGQLFQSISGTSMSSPHIAGSAALVKAAHPDWTPGQIKSALMMTANLDHVKEDGVTPADPFDYGSGRVDLNKAGNPGLTISDTTANFMALQNELWNANYPSLYIPVMQGQMTVQRTVHNETKRNSLWKLSVDSPADLVVDVPTTVLVKANSDATFDITVDASAVPLGEVRHATLYLEHKGETLHFPITVVRKQQVVELYKSCDPLVAEKNEDIECTVTMTNYSLDEAVVSLVDDTPPGLPLVNGSVVGATPNGASSLSFDGTLYAASPPTVDVAPGGLFGYLSLAGFGVTPFGCPSNCDDGAFVISGLDINYLGQNYSSAIWSVNGTLELGTASGVASSFLNQNLPDPAIPNNVLAPWWTDLNLGAGGNWYLATLSGGGQSWDVFEWENVPRFGDAGSTFTFQIWLEKGTENITFVYGPYSGDLGDGTVGAENDDGTAGDAYYFDGTGDLPWGTTDLDVLSVPGTPGETHTIEFAMKGSALGEWTNCAVMTSDAFDGSSTACVNGEVIK